LFPFPCHYFPLVTETTLWTAGVVRRVLPNGLTALVQPDPDAPAVAVVIHVKAGFFDEPDQWQGISHVLEHMFFKGTPTRGVGQIAADTKALGGYLNAATAYDWTSYYVVLPAEGFEKALEIQADALRNASIDAGELSRELKVIIEEAKRKLDTPSALAHETLHQILFDRHRIRRWRIGTEEGLSKFTREDVAGYYGSRYVPERVVVAVVGAVTGDDALAAIDRAFGDWPPRPAMVDSSPDEPWRRDVRVKTLRGDVRQADLVVGWRGVPHLDPDALPLDLAAMVLSSGRGSWLYQALRQPGIATAAAAYHYSPTEVGVMSIGVDLPAENIGLALDRLAGLVNRLRKEGPTPADLDRVRTLLTAQMARRLESVDGRASAFAMAEALGGYHQVDDEYHRLMAISGSDVRRVAERYLSPDSVAVVAYLPQTVGSDLDPATVQGVFATGGSDVLRANGSAAPLPVPPPARAAPRAERARVTHVSLASVDLLIQRKASVPLVTLGLYRRRQRAETAERAGLGALAVRAAARGAGPYDSAALADQFERLGGTLGTSVAADWYGYGVSVLATHCDQAARLLAEVLWRPRFDPTEVDRERENLTNEARQVADDMFRRPVDLGFAAAFGDQGYGLPVKGRPESLAALSAEDVVRWHGHELATGRSVLVAVGALDPALAADRLAALFTDLPAFRDPPRTAPAEWMPKESARVELRSKAQTALTMVFPGPSRSAVDRHAAEVLTAVASGLGGRLFDALREKRSLAYSVLMSSWQRMGAGALVTYIATSPDREEEARSAMLEELHRLTVDLVAPDELERAVNYLSGQAVVHRQTAGAVASEIVDAWLLGTGLDELIDPAAPYRAVTRESVRDVAARYLDHGWRAEGVVRGAQA
jgi:zinc protease